MFKFLINKDFESVGVMGWEDITGLTGSPHLMELFREHVLIMRKVKRPIHVQNMFFEVDDMIDKENLVFYLIKRIFRDSILIENSHDGWPLIDEDQLTEEEMKKLKTEIWY